MRQHFAVAADEIANQEQNDSPKGATQEGVNKKQRDFHFRKAGRKPDYVADAGKKATGEHRNRAMFFEICLYHDEFVRREEEIFAIALHEAHAKALGEPIGEIGAAHRPCNAAEHNGQYMHFALMNQEARRYNRYFAWNWREGAFEKRHHEEANIAKIMHERDDPV